MSFFVDDIGAFGDAPALIDEAQRITTYSELARAMEEFAALLGDGRELVFLEAENNLASVIALMACLKARHPLILGSHASRERTIAAFSPNIIIDSSGSIQRIDDTKLECHPDLALMLSTSGSTGATKLVRLSHAAVHANALSITEYLNIGDDDRAITTLPISYSYGLSVLNSHLLAGASVAMTQHSVVDDAFWALFDATEATSLAGVPYTYELFEATRLRERTPGSLRTMTQAGGRLSPELVSTYHGWAEDQGVSFYTMYGQTEATARMAYLPIHEMEGHMDCIGRAVPGGHLRVVDEAGQSVAMGGTGELVYRGPNVMMGYAVDRADLERGRDISELHTGDLAQEVSEGLFRITGRASRFSKIAGLRVSYDEIEGILRQAGVAAIVSGDDDLVAIGIIDAGQVAQAAMAIDEKTTIPLRSRVIFSVGEVPRLQSGKIDYKALLDAGRAASAAAERSDQGGAPGMSDLARCYARALNRRSVTVDDSFASLGGDSLAYIEVSMAIEKKIGTLPEHWERLTLGEIEALSVETGPPRLRSRSSPTEMLIRPVAMTMVITGHIVDQYGGGGEAWKGGAIALLMTAGYNATRFQRDRLVSPERWQLIVQFVGRFLIPYYLLIAFKAILPGENDISWATPFMLGSYVPDENSAAFARYWFLEALLHLTIITVVIFSVRPIREYAVKHRWKFALIVVAIASVVKFAMPFALSDETNRLPHRLDSWAYAYALGWAAADAHNLFRKLLCVSLAIVLCGLDWGFGNLHTVFLAGAVALILFVPRIPLWAPIAGAAAFFAQSTFYIYLSHGLTTRIALLAHIKEPVIVVAAAVVVGMIGYVVWRGVERAVARLFHGLRDVPQRLAVDV